jgi:hypothetical protein
LGRSTGFFFRNTYVEKKIDFLANHLLQASQVKDGSISEWIQKIQTLASQFLEAGLFYCSTEERAGILNLADRLRNICLCRAYVLTEFRQSPAVEKVIIFTR